MTAIKTLPLEFISAQYGGGQHDAGAYTGKRVEGIVANNAVGVVISVLKNKYGMDVKEKYCGAAGDPLLMPNFIRADLKDDYFTEITTNASCIFVEAQP